MKSKAGSLNNNYQDLVSCIAETYETGHQKAVAAVNSNMGKPTGK